MESLRKECITIFAKLSSTPDRLIALDCVKDIIEIIPITAIDPFYVLQYEYLLNWYYFELWSNSSRTERRRAFADAKTRYMHIFSLIKNWDVYDKLRSHYLWSQICYEFSEFVDAESLSLSDQILNEATGRLEAEKKSADSTISASAFDEVRLRRRLRRIDAEISGIILNVKRCRTILDPSSVK